MVFEWYNLEQIPEPITDVFASGVVHGALIGVGIVLAVILVSALYAYFALAWYRIAQKLKCKNAWVAWVPFANIGLMLHLGGIHWGWAFLILVPILGWIALYVLVIIATWHVFEARGYAGWASLSLVIPQVGMILYGIALGFVVWHDNPQGAFRATPKPKRRR